LGLGGTFSQYKMSEIHEQKQSLTEVKYQDGKLKDGKNGARYFR